MKKNAMLKVAAGLMVAVLLTTCAISSTFAKYTATGTPSDAQTARVAVWGLDVETTATGALFAKTYTTNDDSTESVQGFGTMNIVAPGTTNGGTFTTEISGISEVAFELTPVATVTLTNWPDDKCPLVFTVDGQSYKVGDEDIADTDALAGKVAEAIENLAKKNGLKYAAGSEISESLAVNVTWSWPWTETAENEYSIDALTAEATAPQVSVALGYNAAQIDTFS